MSLTATPAPVTAPAGIRLGLALSGGGKRSAAFNVGVLQALHEQDWLIQVGMISAVSGGTYQGRLTVGGQPASGAFDLRFTLFNAASGGAPVGQTLVFPSVGVVGGAFTVMLDFGAGAFDGNARWLEVAVRHTGQGASFTPLDPRQTITLAPYALYALTPAGPAGPAGPQGPTGPQGAKGNTGATGLQGLAGPRGSAGATGPSGPMGPIGPTGPIGPKGLNWRGSWSAATAYALADAVSHNSASWMAKTDKGLPHYREAEESDVYVLSGSEDLVPVLATDGTRFRDDTTAPGYVIHRYRPRIEGLFARLERWTHTATGTIHWRSITRDNVTTAYGKDDNSRIFDPADPTPAHPTRIFSWRPMHANQTTPRRASPWDRAGAGRDHQGMMAPLSPRPGESRVRSRGRGTHPHASWCCGVAPRPAAPSGPSRRAHEAEECSCLAGWHGHRG